jgi:DNA-binding transcriptional regulator YdaS (Cro superfamily)
MNTLPEQIAAYGNNRMATALQVSPQAVSKWAKRGVIPPRRVLAVAELLGTTPQSLSPEVFGREVDAAKATP